MGPHNQPAPDPLVGELIDGKYRVLRRIGAGGMGAVYEGRHEAINRRVAIKVMLPHIAHDPKVKQRFLNEARIGGELGQENIVEVTDLGELPSGAPYLIMEYLQGRNLSQLIKAQGPLPLGMAVEIVGRVLEALTAVHQAGVVHRDLKPGNVFLAEDTSPTGRRRVVVKVLDFGISKLRASDDPELTRDGAQMGSPAFMSPEQARDTKGADHLSDIYSAGALLYSALTGKAPFQGTTSEILASVMRDDLMPPSQHRPDLPPGLELVVLRAMAREPSQRYQSARELLAALEPFLPAQSMLADKVHQTPTTEAAEPPSETISLSSLSSVVVPEAGASSRWLKIAALVLSVLLVTGTAAVLGILASRGSGEPSPEPSSLPSPESPVTSEALRAPDRSEPEAAPLPEPSAAVVAHDGVTANEPVPPVAPDVPPSSDPEGGVSGQVTPSAGGGTAAARPTKAVGTTTKAPSGPSPASTNGAIRGQVQRRLAAVRSAVATCVAGRATRVSCILVLDGSGGASVSVTSAPPSTTVPGCVRAVVQGLRFPTFEGEPVRMSHTYRFEERVE